MPNPYSIEYSGNPSDFDGKRIKFHVFKDGKNIEGIGILRASMGIISKRMKIHIECEIFDRYKAEGITVYLDQSEFDRIEEADHADYDLLLETM